MKLYTKLALALLPYHYTVGMERKDFHRPTDDIIQAIESKGIIYKTLSLLQNEVYYLRFLQAIVPHLKASANHGILPKIFYNLLYKTSDITFTKKINEIHKNATLKALLIQFKHKYPQACLWPIATFYRKLHQEFQQTTSDDPHFLSIKDDLYHLTTLDDLLESHQAVKEAKPIANCSFTRQCNALKILRGEEPEVITSDVIAEYEKIIASYPYKSMAVELFQLPKNGLYVWQRYYQDLFATLQSTGDHKDLPEFLFTAQELDYFAPQPNATKHNNDDYLTCLQKNKKAAPIVGSPGKKSRSKRSRRAGKQKKNQPTVVPSTQSIHQSTPTKEVTFTEPVAHPYQERMHTLDRLYPSSTIIDINNLYIKFRAFGRIYCFYNISGNTDHLYSDQPIQQEYHERVTRWLTHPETTFKKVPAMPGLSKIKRIAFHQLPPILLGSLRSMGIETTFTDSKGQAIPSLIFAGNIEMDGELIEGFFTIGFSILPGQENCCYHAFFIQQPLQQSLISLALNHKEKSQLLRAYHASMEQ